MKVIDFRYVTTDDIYDEYYNDGYAWSRVYEYPLVLNTIKKYYNDNSLIHNSSWGFEGVHVKFKDMLDQHYNVQHSDIRQSTLKNTFIYDITKNDFNLKEKFDIVVNISTLEEVSADHISVFNNLYDQVKIGGYFICTFDLPGLQLESFEKLFQRKIIKNESVISGLNSKLQNSNCSHLNCGFMVINKQNE